MKLFTDNRGKAKFYDVDSSVLVQALKKAGHVSINELAEEQVKCPHTKHEAAANGGLRCAACGVGVAKRICD